MREIMNHLKQSMKKPKLHIAVPERPSKPFKIVFVDLLKQDVKLT